MVTEYGDDDGEFMAWLAFTRMTGIESITDVNNMLKSTDQITTTALLKEGKYEVLDGKLPRTKQESDFTEENPEIVEKYPETYLYLMEDIHIKGELESTFLVNIKTKEV